MTGVSIGNRNGTTVVDVDKKTPDPVTAVITALTSLGVPPNRTFIDMTGLKPSRFQDGDMERLFRALPQESGLTYIVGLDERIVA